MPRRPRLKLKFNEESVNYLLQEIYDDNINTKTKLTALINKWESKVKEEGHIASLGDQIIKLFNTQVKNQDQKIILLKYLKEVVYRDKTTDETTESNSNQVSPQSREALIKMVQEGLVNDKKIK